MTLTVMSDDEAVAAITVHSKQTIIPSSRLLDSNNSATPELTSHKQVQQPVQPNTAPTTNPRNAKRNADDAGWSSSLSNQDKDLDNEYQYTRSSAFIEPASHPSQILITLVQLVHSAHTQAHTGTHEDSINHDVDVTDDGDDENHNNSDGFLQDINVQDIAVPGTVRRQEKTWDVNTFFGKSYAHKAKDGKTRNVRVWKLNMYLGASTWKEKSMVTPTGGSSE
ncbi:hypothetical protein DEU56DRAFT_787993 [Suillus clintonianus]|uniref:uncharacterized protein n=1 Tax=Suillus clintonianus TaxID=1904413 RepID=UPI001B8777B9|nr:uncharacterized protein DEU56DRAFT_787993 [Suillus clintonianus]KAG2145786.1 hypothetical protein DEU56DRAFT_787993 [Suillus clintonianus]